MSDPFTRAREFGYRQGLIKIALNPRTAVFDAIPAAMKGEFAARGGRLYSQLRRDPNVGSGLFASMLQGYRQVDDIDALRSHFAPLRDKAWRQRATNPEAWKATHTAYRDAMRNSFAQLGNRATQRERMLDLYPKVTAGVGLAGTGAYVAGDYFGKQNRQKEVEKSLQSAPLWTRLKYLMSPNSVI